MVENIRNTANFGISPFSPNQNLQVIDPRIPNMSRTGEYNSEGFQFSFNENSKEGVLDSRDPSPSPKLDLNKTIPQIGDELSYLQIRVREINSRLEHNLEILKEKQEKNENLKRLLDNREARSTFPTDGSFIDQGCSCNKVCVLY